MKHLFTALILTLFFGGFVAQTASAQDDLQKITIRVGKKQKASRSKVTIKFLELIEDSRCPANVQCIQAGNATIKVLVSKPNSDAPVTLELNTNLGAKGGVFANYVINLVKLTPTPAANVRLNRNAYTATFTIHRIMR